MNPVIAMAGTRISNEELDKILSQAEEKERKDPKKRWITRMMRSASNITRCAHTTTSVLASVS